MALIWGNGGLSIRFYDRDPGKAHPCFGVFCVKIRPGPLAVASCKNPPPKNGKTNTFLVRKVTHARIVTNFCTGVGVHDVITCADLYYDRLRGLREAGVKFWLYPLTCFVALTTLTTVRVCDSSILYHFRVI